MASNQTIYVVSGFMRSGTSMMMDCLSASGLEVAYDPDRDKLNELHGDSAYRPNPNGFYELDRDTYRDEDFPLQFQGKLIKCLAGGLQRFPVHDYKVVFMRRDKEEIRQSLIGFFQIDERQKGRINDFFDNRFDKIIDRALSMLRNRLDTDVTELWYRDVVKSPELCFASLIYAGWPISLHKSSSVVNPELCRFKKESLEVGI